MEYIVPSHLLLSMSGYKINCRPIRTKERDVTIKLDSFEMYELILFKNLNFKVSGPYRFYVLPMIDMKLCYVLLMFFVYNYKICQIHDIGYDYKSSLSYYIYFQKSYH